LVIERKLSKVEVLVVVIIGDIVWERFIEVLKFTNCTEFDRLWVLRKLLRS
jgi:hypothetical protein